jgi:1,4-dihydroxy-2-naphthoate octaprenyltransferase
MRNWILAIRPKTLFASISPVLLGLALSFHYQHVLHVITALLTILCTVCLQIASNLANDYLDFTRGIDNADRTGPTRATQARLLTPTQMKNALFLMLFLAFIQGIYLMINGGMPIVIIGLLSMYFAYGYTGGPFPLSYNALGEVAAFIFFGPVAVLGTFYLQTHFINFHGWLLGIAAGSISATILAINNLRDMQSDSKTKKKTIALLFGEIFQRRLCLSLISLTVIIIFIHAFLIHRFFALLALIVPILFKSNWKYIYNGTINETLNSTLAKTAQYFFLYSLAICLTLITL